jgi:DNA-binding IclR family transcriptional regulator
MPRSAVFVVIVRTSPSHKADIATRITITSSAVPPANPVRVLGKAAHALDLLAEHGEMTVQDLAIAADEPRSSVYRLLAGLRAVDLVEPGSRRGTYRLGLKLLRLSGAVVTRFDERQAALPAMERLYEQTEETVFLSVLRGREAVCIERIEGRWVQSMALTLGGSLPLHIGAAPRALLAFAGEPAWHEYIAGGERRAFTPSSLVDENELLADLEATRRRGYAVSDEDVVVGMAALGAPIFGYRGALRAAISFSGPRPAVLGERREANVRAIREAAREVSRALGYDPEALGHAAA